MLKIFAHYDSSAGTVPGKNALHLLETADLDLESAIQNLLENFWEEEAPANNGFIITSEEGKTLATLTPFAHDGPNCGIVEVYRVGMNSSLQRYRVKYQLDSEGNYVGTRIDPL